LKIDPKSSNNFRGTAFRPFAYSAENKTKTGDKSNFANMDFESINTNSDVNIYEYIL